MTAPLQASPSLLTSIHRMRAREAVNDGYAAEIAAWENGTHRALSAGAIHRSAAAAGTIIAPKPRQRPRSPDRKASRDRRRRLGGSSALPDTMRHHYTEGQRAVLCIVAGEVKHHGTCDLPIDKIAALAGVGRTTVQTALHIAWKGCGHIKVTRRPRRGKKSLTNLIEIMSQEWLTWIKRGPSAHRPDRVQIAEKTNPTKNKNKDDRGDGSANPPEPSARAVRLATEVARIAGHDPNRLPRFWERQQPAVIVEGWLRDLERVGVPIGLGAVQIAKTAEHVMRRKPEREPPHSIKYFAPTIRRQIDTISRINACLPTRSPAGGRRDFATQPMERHARPR